MTFEVEVLLKGTDEVVTETVTHLGPEPIDWSDEDVRTVLLSTLRVFDRVNTGNTGAGDDVSLRGLSWIVMDVDPGVAIAIEIPSGAVAAGPFDLPAEQLNQMVARVISADAQHSVLH